MMYMLVNTENGEVIYMAECDAEVENFAQDNGYVEANEMIAPYNIIEENEAF